MRLTAQSVPHAQMGRPEVVGMARAKKKKPEQQQAAGPLTSSPAPAEDPPPSHPRAPQPAPRQSLPSCFNPNPVCVCVCGAQAWIEAQLIYIDEEDLFAHLSFYLLFDGVPQYVLSAVRVRA